MKRIKQKNTVLSITYLNNKQGEKMFNLTQTSQTQFTLMSILKLNNWSKRIVSYTLATIVAITGLLSFSPPANAVLAEIATGVQVFEKILAIYTGLNPGQEGYVNVLNTSAETVTVRSYNNNDWLKAVAAGQINLKPGGQAMITAKTDPVALVWKRGDFSTITPFGTKGLSQSLAPKGPSTVFVIGQANTL